MKLSATNSKISFEKQQIASCTVLKNNKPVSCTINLLEHDVKDIKYINKALSSNLWRKSSYMQYMASCIYLPYPNLYTLEDSNGRCLACCHIQTTVDGYRDIHLFETTPNKNKLGYKYIGETFITFLADLAKKNNTFLTVKTSAYDARDFYAKCAFDFIRPMSNYDFMFDFKNLEKLKEQNLRHTTGKINIIV